MTLAREYSELISLNTHLAQWDPEREQKLESLIVNTLWLDGSKNYLVYVFTDGSVAIGNANNEDEPIVALEGLL